MKPFLARQATKRRGFLDYWLQILYIRGNGEKVEELMRHLSDKAKAARNKAAGTAMIVRSVAMPKGNYQLKFISSSQDALDKIWNPLEQVFTVGIGLPRTVNKHLKLLLD